jgi:hypothetical protein
MIVDLKNYEIVLGNLKSSNIVFLDLKESFKPYIIDFSHSF